MHYFSTITFAVVVLFFLIRGYQKGFFSALIRIASCFLGYIIAIVFTPPLSHIISFIPFLDGLIVYVIAGSLILITFITFSDKLGNTLLENFIYKKPMPESVYRLLKIGGGVVGTCVGCFVGFIASYLINFQLSQLSYTASVLEESSYLPNTANQKVTSNKTEPEFTTKHYLPLKKTTKDQESATNTVKYYNIDNYEHQKIADTLIDKVSKKVVSSALTIAIKVTTKDETAAGLAQVVSANPQKSVNYIRRIANDPQIINILSSPTIQAKLRNGNVDLLLVDRTFRKLLNNKNIQALANQSHKDNSYLSNNSYRSDIKTTKMLILTWHRLERIKDDPKILSIIHDPEFQRELQLDSMTSLLLNKKLKNLAELILAK